MGAQSDPQAAESAARIARQRNARILVAEGVPSPEWLNALMFIVAMARETQTVFWGLK
jgi:hypothetical protein